jgi:hypothetical protein
MIMRLPFCHKRSCLPILVRRYLNKKGAARHHRTYRSRLELAVQLLECLCQRYPHHTFAVVADSAYGGKSMLKHLPANCALTSRMLPDARFYAAPESAAVRAAPAWPHPARC